jgi:hypothetical protein
MRFALSAGFALAIVLNGYQAQAQDFEGIDLTPVKKKPVAVPKAKPTELRVKLAKDVSGAKLFIDKVLVGELPQPARVVTPGEHSFSVERLGYKTVEHPITVTKGKLNEVAVTLEAVGGVVTIGANEVGAMCAIDGAAAEEVPVVKVLAPGKHEVRVSKVGFAPHIQVVQVELGVDVAVAAELQPAAVVAANDRPVNVALAPVERDSDLDLERGGARPAEVSGSGQGTPVYKRWYLWAGVGAVVAGGVATAVILSQPRTRPIDPVTVCGGPCDVTIGGP